MSVARTPAEASESMSVAAVWLWCVAGCVAWWLMVSWLLIRTILGVS